MNAWDFHCAGQLTVGRGAIGRSGAMAARRGWRRVWIATDRPLIEAGLVDRVAGPLREAGIAIEVYGEGMPEPSIERAQEAASAARRFTPDAVLGLGGGSNMDLAKIVSVLLAHPGGPRDYLGFDRVPGPVGPLICVPTTAGTGSEVSHSAVLTDTSDRMKVSTLSPLLRPTLAIVDPAMTDGCPRRVTADSGIDALVHAIEAYTATRAEDLALEPGEAIGYSGGTPLTDPIAERAIELVGRHLARAVGEPNDREARDGMALAATLAGIAFSNAGVALVHALEYPIGGAFHCSHGAGNGLLLPHVMRFNLSVRADRMARIAALLGVPVDGLRVEEAAERAIEAVEGLGAAIGIPARLREFGVPRAALPEMARKAFAIRRLRLTNPRACEESDLLAILEAAH
ncbi:MAG: iron-containing alcohol dehydrogenase [Planctomycetes bacterium]|nr:iron-containing alcohol dehydrogenase [Planctomycetota bacterium]